MAKCKNCDALLAVLELALTELEWGDREMRGCPPEHWKWTLAKVREAVGKPSASTVSGGKNKCAKCGIVIGSNLPCGDKGLCRECWMPPGKPSAPAEKGEGK